MKDKKTIVIIILLVIIAGLVGYIFGSGVLTKEKEPQEVKPTKEEVLAKAAGEWGMCTGEYSCFGVFITKKSETEFTYSEYTMWSEFGTAGKITEVTEKAASQYELSVYYEGVDTMEYTVPERTVKHTIDVTKLSEEILSIDGKEYQKVTDDRDAFFRSIM